MQGCAKVVGGRGRGAVLGPTSLILTLLQDRAVSYRLCYKLSPVVVMLDSLTKIRSDLKCEGDILWLRWYLSLWFNPVPAIPLEPDESSHWIQNQMNQLSEIRRTSVSLGVNWFNRRVPPSQISIKLGRIALSETLKDMWPPWLGETVVYWSP